MLKSKGFLRKVYVFSTKLDFKTQIIFFQAYLYTGIARAFILFIPFNKLKKIMGKHKVETPQEVAEDNYKIAREISFAVTQAARYTPWESKCLVQALTAQRMMKERGISTTLYLGVRKDNDNMVAHAWIRCGSYYITGGSNRSGYVVVAKFANL